jgi:hypothetical protein
MFIANFRLKGWVQGGLCRLREVIDFAALHPVRELQKIALQESVSYITANMRDAIGFYTPRGLLEYSLVQLKADGHCLEFGVYSGGSLRYIAERLGKRPVHGFDSFEGLPDNWKGFNLIKGAFSRQGRLPKVPANATLHRGWFDQSLPRWLELNTGPVAFIHVDCDLYSSTRTIFELLAPRIAVGTIIVFDEYFGYPNWQQHEFKAFQEYVKTNNVAYEYLAYSRLQVAVRITKT